MDRVGKEGVQRRGQGACVAWFHEYTHLTAFEHNADLADVGRHDGTCREHRFDERQWQTFRQ